MVILQPKTLVGCSKLVVFWVKDVKLNQKSTILKAFRVERHGILVGNADEAPFTLEDEEEKVVATVDEFGVYLIDSRLWDWLKFQSCHSLNVET